LFVAAELLIFFYLNIAVFVVVVVVIVDVVRSLHRYNSHPIQDFVSKMFMELPDQMIGDKVVELINRSYNHTGTNLYDKFQLATNGIAV
jgi:hypothetical protein